MHVRTERLKGEESRLMSTLLLNKAIARDRTTNRLDTYVWRRLGVTTNLIGAPITAHLFLLVASHCYERV